MRQQRVAADNAQAVSNGRVPLFNVGPKEIDVVYTYNDPNCDPKFVNKHTPPGNVPETDCPTPPPNDPPPP